MRTFLLKAKHFFKRNIYPITVTMCTVLVLGIITISAYATIKGENVVNTNTPPDAIVDNTDDKNNDNNDPSKPTTTDEPIIFDLPFENAEISKEYTETKLLPDATTNYWCTHQGLDFACAEGTIARAVYDGEITKIESSMMNNVTIYLKVSDNLVVVYKGLSSDVKVKEGDKVKKGAELGKVTVFLTEKADGVHLHLEMLKNDKLIDPTDYFAFNK